MVKNRSWILFCGANDLISGTNLQKVQVGRKCIHWGHYLFRSGSPFQFQMRKSNKRSVIITPHSLFFRWNRFTAVLCPIFSPLVVLLAVQEQTYTVKVKICKFLSSSYLSLDKKRGSACSSFYPHRRTRTCNLDFPHHKNRV